MKALPRTADLLDLVRAPAALTVPGDCVVGAAAAGFPFGAAATAGLAGSSALLYWSGMALNDYADRDLDRQQRPERPLPSGRVTERQALALAVSLSAAGLGLAAACGGTRALAVAAPLAAAVWSYDLWGKSTPLAGPLMAACRTLDVLLGAGSGRMRAALPAALTVGAHTLVVMRLSSGEVGGGTRVVPAGALAGTGAVLALGFLIRSGADDDRASVRWRAAPAALYAATAVPPQLAALRAPDGPKLRAATGAAIHSLIPLQALLAAASSRRGRTAALLSGAVITLLPLARWLGRKASVT
ncbi:hypothetical protein ABIA33_003251 [Streptacidiphilus sp. MAP12-16]|uniref:SCO3242 family prenyltransferase n=1 Tax=Streptacidiphilus sp. MAP12-16 TaxID=3156300 RepID=UPI0035134808